MVYGNVKNKSGSNLSTAYERNNSVQRSKWLLIALCCLYLGIFNDKSDGLIFPAVAASASQTQQDDFIASSNDPTRNIAGVNLMTGNDGIARAPATKNIGKRSWNNLQGSWGKRQQMNRPLRPSEYSSEEYKDDIGDLGLLDMDGLDFGDTVYNRHPERVPIGHEVDARLQNVVPADVDTDNTIIGPTINEHKKAWKAMNSAWGKRLGNSANGDWNRFRGSWGKREPGWNNLKGLWGKRSNTPANWNKLQSAWGKRASSSVYDLQQGY